jgi:oxygen-independent coproporphyrinogen-3 oxidase
VQAARAGSPDKTPVALIEHPDVRRMLMRMKAQTQAARALVYYAAGQVDRANLGDAAARDRLEIATPLAKAHGTDIGNEVASLGVQVLDPEVQARINRIQPRMVIESAIRRLRDAGVEGVNIDMMYGLPGQTLEHVVETATFASTQDADRVAVFGYAHVPWMKKHQKGIRRDDLPSGEARFQQAEAAARTLTRAGYMPIGFDHFAAPGDSLATAEQHGQLHRNFQGYTDDACDALIGLGASAISSLPGLFYQNTADTSAYRSMLSQAQSPVVRGLKPSQSDRRVGGVIERILCDFEATLDADLRIAACSSLAPFLHAGLVRLQGNHLSITARGRPYVRNVAACFDPDFVQKPTTHSLAI